MMIGGPGGSVRSARAFTARKRARHTRGGAAGHGARDDPLLGGGAGGRGHRGGAVRGHDARRRARLRRPPARPGARAGALGGELPGRRHPHRPDGGADRRLHHRGPAPLRRRLSVTHPATAAGALALGAALVLGAATAPAVLLVAVLLVQGVLLTGWHRSLAVSGAVAGSVVAGAAALGADVVVLLGEGDRPLHAVPAALALAGVAALVQQLVRRDGRPGLTASLAATVTLTALAAMAAAFLASEAAEGGPPLVAAAAVSAGLVAGGSVLRRRLGGPGWLDPAAAAVLAVPVGLVVSA